MSVLSPDTVARRLCQRLASYERIISIGVASRLSVIVNDDRSSAALCVHRL